MVALNDELAVCLLRKEIPMRHFHRYAVALACVSDGCSNRFIVEELVPVELDREGRQVSNKQAQTTGKEGRECFTQATGRVKLKPVTLSVTCCDR